MTSKTPVQYEGEQVKSCDFVRIPMGGEGELVYSPVGESAALLRPHQITQLSLCRRFASVAEHARSIAYAANSPNAAAETIEKNLTSMSDSGMLTPKSAVLKIMKAGSDSAKQEEDLQKLATLAIPTKDRAESLARCVESYVQCAKRSEREISVVVSDDSVSDSGVAANADALRSIADKYQVETLHLTGSRRTEMAKRIAAEAGVDPTIVDFALLNKSGYPVSTGANRNCLLLAGTNGLSVQVDDDTSAKLIKCPSPGETTKVTSSYDYMSYWYFDAGEWESISAEEGADFFALHETILGKRLSSFAADLDAFDLDGIESPLLKRLTNNDRITMSALGVAGDSGGGGVFPMLRHDAQTRGRLVRNEQVYRHTMQTHQILRCPPSLMLTDTRACSGLNLGLDGRGILPPFLPVQRNQDGVFGALFYIGMEGLSAHLPGALLHRRDEQRKADPSARVGTASGEIIEMIASAFKPIPSAGAAANFVSIGHLMRELGSAALPEFERLIGDMVYATMLYRINHLDALLRKYGGHPRYWAEDVVAYCNALRKFLVEGDLAMAGDLDRAFGKEGARLKLQEMLRRFGEVLIHWPAIWDAAHKLHRAEKLFR